MQALARSIRPWLCEHIAISAGSRATSGNTAVAVASAAACQPSQLSLPWRQLTTSPAARGLEEFFDVPGKDGAAPSAGRSWLARELRQKSWDDLHKLWYVLLKERNMLQSERLRAKAANVKMLNPTRCTKVRKSMARLKHVLGERVIAHPDKQMKHNLKAFIDAI